MGGLPIMRRSQRKQRCIRPLNNVADVYEPVTPTDGETKPTWKLRAESMPCSKRYTGGGERVSGGDRVVELPSLEVSFRFIPWLDSRHRLRFPSSTDTEQVVEINSVGDPDGDRQYMVAMCTILEST